MGEDVHKCMIGVEGEGGERVGRQLLGFAHRGARAVAPENALPAFHIALEAGCPGLDSDVWLTRRIRALLDLGCDAVYSDHVDRVVGVLAERAG